MSPQNLQDRDSFEKRVAAREQKEVDLGVKDKVEMGAGRCSYRGGNVGG